MTARSRAPEYAALGVRTHTGWAVVILAGGTAKHPQIIHRGSIQRCDLSSTESKFPVSCRGADGVSACGILHFQVHGGGRKARWFRNCQFVENGQCAWIENSAMRRTHGLGQCNTGFEDNPCVSHAHSCGGRRILSCRNRGSMRPRTHQGNSPKGTRFGWGGLYEIEADRKRNQMEDRCLWQIVGPAPGRRSKAVRYGRLAGFGSLNLAKGPVYAHLVCCRKLGMAFA